MEFPKSDGEFHLPFVVIDVKTVLMTNTKASTHTHLAVCSVCFATHFINPAHSGLNPIRHGFSIVGGQGQGHAGGWHTGPCAGVGFPHFGHSTEGTVWALGQVNAAIQTVEKHLAWLGTNPDLAWSYQPKKYQAATWQNRKSSYVPAGDAITRTLKLGTEVEVIEYDNPAFDPARPFFSPAKETVKAPSYAQEHGSRTREAQAKLDSLKGERDMYETAIKTWKPQAPVQAPGKVEIVHKAFHSKHRGYATPACNFRTPSYKAAGMKLTDNPEEVTCQRCKKVH